MSLLTVENKAGYTPVGMALIEDMKKAIPGQRLEVSGSPAVEEENQNISRSTITHHSPKPLTRKTKVNRKNPNGETALHVTCRNNNITRVRELLNEPDIDVNARDNAGWTPLHEACNHGHTACVKELLKFAPGKGKITNSGKRSRSMQTLDLLAAPSKCGTTPLHDAVFNEQIEVVKLLVEAGGMSLLTVENKAGYTPVGMALTEDMKEALLGQRLEVSGSPAVEEENKNISRSTITHHSPKPLTRKTKVNCKNPNGISDSYIMPKARRAYSCTQCFFISERSHDDLKRHFSTCHGEGQSHGRESSPERTTPICTALQSIITPKPGSAEKRKGQQKALRKPNVIPVSSDSDSSEFLPNTFINQPSHSCTTFDKPKKEKIRIGPTPNGDSKKKKFVRFNVNSHRSSESAGFGSKTAMCALTGVNITSVYQLKKRKEPNEVDSSLNEEIPEARKRHSCTQCFYTTKRSHDLKRHLFRRHGEGQSHGRESSPERTTPICTALQSIITPKPGSAEKRKGQQKALRKPGVASHIVSSDSGLSESVQDIFINQPSHSRTPIDKPKKEKTGTGPISGTVIVPPEAAPDREQDGYKSKELRKQSPRKRKDSNNKNAPPTVLCTVCRTRVNPFDRKTFFRHPVLSVVICKACLEFYNRSLWNKDKGGMEEECGWCGEGGSLCCCDFCCKTFCKQCIIHTSGIDELQHILKKKWKCYVCDPSPLKELVGEYSALVARSLETEQKKKVKAPKKEKMQDATIAEEFLQYLVGNNSNRAQFMRSLVRLKKEVPDMQKLQMNLSLKHIGEVKSVLEEFEACVKRQLHGDAHKSDSALDGTNQVDCERPEEKSKSQMEETQVKTQEKEELAGIDEAKEESAMETAEDDGVDNYTKPRKKKKCEPEKMELNGTLKWREGPGEDSSNPEEESGFDGIPGESSTGSSQDEGGEKEDKVGRVKDLPAVTVTRSSRHSFAASESDSSESKSVNSDDNYTKPRRRRLSRKKKKCEPEKMDSASEEDMKLKRNEGIRGLKRKCYSATDSDDASENVPDAQIKPEEGKTESVAKRGEEKSDVEKESESEGNPSKKAKKVRKSPAKIDLKRELLSSNSSSDDESNAESDGFYGVSWKSLNEMWDSREVAENLLMDELDFSNEEDNDDDDDKDDEDEEVGNAGSKQSKKKAVKKAEEDEDGNNSERRQNGTGGGGGSRDGKNGGFDKKKTKRKDPTWDLYKRPKNNWNARKKAKEDVEFNNSERRNGTGGGGGSRDGKNGGDDKKKKGKGQDESTKKSHSLLVISPFSEDEEDEETSK